MDLHWKDLCPSITSITGRIYFSQWSDLRRPHWYCLWYDIMSRNCRWYHDVQRLDSLVSVVFHCLCLISSWMPRRFRKPRTGPQLILLRTKAKMSTIEQVHPMFYRRVLEAMKWETRFVISITVQSTAREGCRRYDANFLDQHASSFRPSHSVLRSGPRYRVANSLSSIDMQLWKGARQFLVFILT